MPEKGRRHFLKARDAKSLVAEASRKLEADLQSLFESNTGVESLTSRSLELLLVKGKPVLARIGSNIFPTLKFVQYYRLAPKVVVDMGAVPHICKGADVMAPGIRRFEGHFSRNSIVFVVDETHGEPIAVGQISYDEAEARNIKRGIVVKTIHYVGDSTWNLMKELGA